MAEAYVKLYRKLRYWEWYDDINTCHLFIHCLLRAEWQPGSWHGIPYEAGQFITSLPNLSKETGLSQRQVRTALDHLKSTGELTSHQHGNVRIITVLKWSEYQASDRDVDRVATGKRQGDDRVPTACKEYKEYKNKKNKRYARSPKSGIDYDQVAEDLKG